MDIKNGEIASFYNKIFFKNLNNFLVCVLHIVYLKNIGMFFIIFFFLFVFVSVIVFVPSIILTIVSKILALFGLAPKQRQYHQNDEPHKSEKHEHSPKKGKKIFDKDEGEYVDFEEIK